MALVSALESHRVAATLLHSHHLHQHFLVGLVGLSVFELHLSILIKNLLILCHELIVVLQKLDNYRLKLADLALQISDLGSQIRIVLFEANHLLESLIEPHPQLFDLGRFLSDDLVSRSQVVGMTGLHAIYLVFKLLS